MKSLYFFNSIIIYSLLLISCQAKTERVDTSFGRVSFDKKVDKSDSISLFIDNSHYDFGTINKSEKPELIINFMLKNKGTVPLVIIKADVSCGCVSADYPKEPIMPDKEKKLQVKIRTINQHGYFNKTIILKSNAPEKYSLIRIKGNIK